MPPGKDRPVSFALIAIKTPADVVTATGALLAAVVKGQVTAGEAQTIAAVIDTHRVSSSWRTLNAV